MTLLNLLFLLLAVASFLWWLWRFRRQMDKRRNGQAVGSGEHMVNFLSWMGIAMGIVGLMALRAPLLYDWMGGDAFLGRQLGDEALMGFIAIVVSVPVALAGSAYAVLLAFKSIELSEKQVELDRSDQQDRQTDHYRTELALVATNFTRLSDALQRLNAAATVCTETGFQIAGEVAGGCNATRQLELHANLETVALMPFRDAINFLGDTLATLGQHDMSLAMLDRRVRACATSDRDGEGLLAAQLLRHRFVSGEGQHGHEFEHPEDRDRYFRYASPDAEPLAAAQSLLDAVEVLRMQAARLHVQDIIIQTIAHSIHETVSDLREGVSIDPRALAQRFYYDWRRSPTRARDPKYIGHHAMRMLYDIPVRLKSPFLLGPSTEQVLCFGPVVIFDLHAVIPGKEDFAGLLVEWGSQGMGTLESESITQGLVAALRYSSKPRVTWMAREWMAQMAEGVRDPSSRNLFKERIDQENLDRIYASLSNCSGPQDFERDWIVGARAQIRVSILGREMLDARRVKGPSELLPWARAAEKLALHKADDIAMEWRLLKARLAAGVDPSDPGIEPDLADAASRAGQPSLSLSPERIAAINLEHYAAAVRSGVQGPAVVPDDVWRVSDSLDWTLVLQEWAVAQFWSLPPVGVEDKGRFILTDPEEVGANDGLLAMIAGAITGAFRHQPVAEPHEFSLSFVALQAHCSLEAPFAPLKLVRAFDQWVKDVPRRPGSDGSVDALDATALWDAWSKRYTG